MALSRLTDLDEGHCARLARCGAGRSMCAARASAVDDACKEEERPNYPNSGVMVHVGQRLHRRGQRQNTDDEHRQTWLWLAREMQIQCFAVWQQGRDGTNPPALVEKAMPWRRDGLLSAQLGSSACHQLTTLPPTMPLFGEQRLPSDTAIMQGRPCGMQNTVGMQRRRSFLPAPRRAWTFPIESLRIYGRGW